MPRSRWRCPKQLTRRPGEPIGDDLRENSLERRILSSAVEDELGYRKRLRLEHTAWVPMAQTWAS
jgi:hypothetical protein